MTCIVAVSDGSQVVMAGDSIAAGVRNFQMLRGDSKVVRNGRYLLGFTTSFRMGQLLMEAELPEPPVTQSVQDSFRFMIREFVPAIRAVFEMGGYFKAVQRRVFDQDETHHNHGGTFLVAFGFHIFGVHDDFSVSMTEQEYRAVGGGCLPALGALSATSSLDVDLVDRASLALHASETHSTACRRPFRFLTTSYDDESSQVPRVLPTVELDES